MGRLLANRHGQPAILVILACLPVVLATISQVVGSVAQPIRESDPPPSLIFQQYLARPYLPEPQAVVSARYRFVNMGTEPVVIERIERSCGCLGEQLRKKRFEPGEDGELMLKVQTANEAPGLKEFYAVVHYTDPLPRTAKLTFKFEIPEQKVTVEPRALLFYQFGSTPSEKEITLTDFRRDHLQILDIRCTSPLVEIGEVLSQRTQEGLEHRFTVTVAGDAPPGQHRSVVTVYTNDVAYPQIIVPVYVQGPTPSADSAVQVTPTELRLSRSKSANAPVDLTVRCSNENSDFEVRAVESVPPGILVQLAGKQVVDGEQIIKGRIGLHADFPQGSDRGLLTIHTNDPERPQIEVPIQIVP